MFEKFIMSMEYNELVIINKAKLKEKAQKLENRII